MSFYFDEINNEHFEKDFREEMFNDVMLIYIHELTPNKANVNYEEVLVKKRGKNLTKPLVLLKESRKIIIDGHHTIIAKMLKGQQKVNCKVLNYSNI